jgi:hypothetical protein
MNKLDMIYELIKDFKLMFFNATREEEFALYMRLNQLEAEDLELLLGETTKYKDEKEML